MTHEDIVRTQCVVSTTNQKQPKVGSLVAVVSVSPHLAQCGALSKPTNSSSARRPECPIDFTALLGLDAVVGRCSGNLKTPRNNIIIVPKLI